LTDLELRNSGRETSGIGGRTALILVLAYVAVVHTIDTLAAHSVHFIISWHVFDWQAANGFDYFKFLAWFIAPLIFSLRGFDTGWLGLRRWRRVDLVILGVLAAVGVACVLIIPVFPSLQAVYSGWGRFPAKTRCRLAQHAFVWTFSWVIGWEFLHRHVLLKRLTTVWPRYGWLLIPLIEGVYHLQKPLLEAGGMVVFSLVLTPWAAKRRNVLLPFLAHLLVELELLAFLMVS